jgi:hypothetical protein
MERTRRKDISTAALKERLESAAESIEIVVADLDDLLATCHLQSPHLLRPSYEAGRLGNAAAGYLRIALGLVERG